MDDLRAEALEVLASLNEEQLLLLLAYARCLKDGAEAFAAPHAIEGLLEERA